MIEAYTVSLKDASYFCLLCKIVHTYHASDEFNLHRDWREKEVEWIYERDD